MAVEKKPRSREQGFSSQCANTMVLLKRNVHRSLYVSLGIGGEKIGVVTLSQGCQTLLDALHIHRSGDQHRLRAHEIARMRYPVTTQYLRT